jgi:hypothetical protein
MRKPRRRERSFYGWVAFGVLAFVALMVVVGVNLPRPSHKELARRAIAEARRQQDREAEIRQTKDAVERCVDYARKSSPNYNQTFNAGPSFITNFGGAEFQWHKCTASMGRPQESRAIKRIRI